MSRTFLAVLALLAAVGVGSELEVARARRMIQLRGHVTVVSADVFRDGGSIGVVLMDSKGNHRTFFLDHGISSPTQGELFDDTRTTFDSPHHREALSSEARRAVKTITAHWVRRELWLRGLFTVSRMEAASTSDGHRTLYWAHRFSEGF